MGQDPLSYLGLSSLLEHLRVQFCFLLEEQTYHITDDPYKLFINLIKVTRLKLLTPPILSQFSPKSIITSLLS